MPSEALVFGHLEGDRLGLWAGSLNTVDTQPRDLRQFCDAAASDFGHALRVAKVDARRQARPFRAFGAGSARVGMPIPGAADGSRDGLVLDISTLSAAPARCQPRDPPSRASGAGPKSAPSPR